MRLGPSNTGFTAKFPSPADVRLSFCHRGGTLLFLLLLFFGNAGIAQPRAFGADAGRSPTIAGQQQSALYFAASSSSGSSSSSSKDSGSSSKKKGKKSKKKAKDQKTKPDLKKAILEGYESGAKDRVGKLVNDSPAGASGSKPSPGSPSAKSAVWDKVKDSTSKYGRVVLDNALRAGQFVKGVAPAAGAAQTAVDIADTVRLANRAFNDPSAKNRGKAFVGAAGMLGGIAGGVAATAMLGATAPVWVGAAVSIGMGYAATQGVKNGASWLWNKYH